MGIHYVSAKDFNRDPGRAKKAAEDGAVFITNRSEPTHVLMRIEEFRRLTQPRGSLVDKLAMPDAADIDFDPPRMAPGWKPATFD